MTKINVTGKAPISHDSLLHCLNSIKTESMRTKSLNYFLYNHFAGFCSTNTNKTLHTYEFCYLFKKCKLFSVTTVVYYNTKERARKYTRKQQKKTHPSWVMISSLYCRDTMSSMLTVVMLLLFRMVMGVRGWWWLPSYRFWHVM